MQRYGDRFGQNGFRYLLENGSVYTAANYDHANTETIVGHATLSTGAHPSEHGMVGNVWYDRDSGELAYNIEDPDHEVLPTRKEEREGAQVDPAQKRSRSSGRSPVSLLASTFGDELWIHTAGKSNIFGVSGKDRSAVAMAGHVGKAFWYSTNTGDFLSSSYYYDAYPAWVSDWNNKRQAEQLDGQSWELLNDQQSYLLADKDNRPFETDLKGYGKTFPHAFGDIYDPLFFTRVLVSSEGDRLTAEFAKSLIKEEQVGADDVPDYLSISFSGVDAVNHFFGPSSLENEDVVLQLDKTLSGLLGFVDENVGLDNTLIVLSADHGMPEAPEVLAEQGMQVGRIDPLELVGIANSATNAAFGIPDAVRTFFRPYVYLNTDEIVEAGVEQIAVETVISEALEQHAGVAAAVSMKALPNLTDTPTLRRIRNNFHPLRSGDIYVAQAPYWFLQEGSALAVMHGSPWRYDTHVPIIFAGKGIPAQSISRAVKVVDVVPTMAMLMGVKPPSSSQGEPLFEVVDPKVTDQE
ncbi:alkaline phosphatase family protein [Roseibium sp.]|uniref:alkaline phosphatase family protein n=1 Tax=Roseibium sp. TaxID=1936156 RepID=UPI003B525E0B